MVHRHAAVRRLGDCSARLVRVDARRAPRRSRSRGVITSRTTLLAELHDAADDRASPSRADALELALAQQILSMRGSLGRRRRRPAPRDRRARAPRGDASRTGAATTRPAAAPAASMATSGGGPVGARSRGRRSWREQHDQRRAAASAVPHATPIRTRCDAHQRRPRRAPAPTATVGGGEQPLRPVEVAPRRRGAAELAFGPVAQPDATHRPDRRGAGRQPARWRPRRAGRRAPIASRGLLVRHRRAPSRSKYTRSMRRRRTRSTTIRNSPIVRAISRARHAPEQRRTPARRPSSRPRARTTRRARRTARRAAPGPTPRTGRRPPLDVAAPRRRTRRGSRPRSPRGCPRS